MRNILRAGPYLLLFLVFPLFTSCYTKFSSPEPTVIRETQGRSGFSETRHEYEIRYYEPPQQSYKHLRQRKMRQRKNTEERKRELIRRRRQSRKQYSIAELRKMYNILEIPEETVKKVNQPKKRLVASSRQERVSRQVAKGRITDKKETKQITSQKERVFILNLTEEKGELNSKFSSLPDEVIKYLRTMKNSSESRNYKVVALPSRDGKRAILILPWQAGRSEKSDLSARAEAEKVKPAESEQKARTVKRSPSTKSPSSRRSYRRRYSPRARQRGRLKKSRRTARFERPSRTEKDKSAKSKSVNKKPEFSSPSPPDTLDFWLYIEDGKVVRNRVKDFDYPGALRVQSYRRVKGHTVVTLVSSFNSKVKWKMTLPREDGIYRVKAVLIDKNRRE